MRERLEKNYELNLTNQNLQKTFIIDSFVGEGASCLVYNAKYIDELGIIRNVRIKELYPLECSEIRNNHHIIWATEDKKNYYIPQFENLYSRQIYFQNMTSFTNSSTQIIDNIYEANNTKYIILDCANGKTFDKYQPNHLSNIFEVLLSLTKLVKKYHDKDYLMLDIKPENFLTIDETNQLIKYLDFDSIMSLYTIKNITGLSCSLKYAAPELLRGDINKIGKCSDIYSIGAILYKKIFDLDVTSNERSIGFNPNYDNKYFTNINPKIYKKLTAFFRKTLCNNSKRRYQDCDEMIRDLEELIELANPNSLQLISSNIIQNNYFIGREEECISIDNAFKNGKKIVFINGCGGIGKTELAKYYANSRNKNFHTIIFGKCTNGLKEVFENDDIFTIRNLRKNEISLEEKIKMIQQLVDEETLIVIDNLDVLNDPYFETLCLFNCKILITTRAYLEGIISNTDTSEIIPINPLYLEDSYHLFTYYYQRNVDDNEKQSIYEIIKHIEGFTLMIPILAKQLMLESILPSTMYEKLRNSKLKGISNSLVKHYKDNNIIHADAYSQVISLFDVFELSKCEKEVLYIMSLLGNISISKRTLALFAGQFELTKYNANEMIKNFESEIESLKETVNVKYINSLIEKGYLEYDVHYDLVRCHNIIREISLYEFDLSLSDTTIFKDLFSNFINKLRRDFYESRHIEYNPLNNYKCLNSVYENELKQLCFNIFDNVDFSNTKNQEIITKSLIKHIMPSKKDYSYVIRKYKNNTIKRNIECLLLVCEWIQKLCLNVSSEELIEKLNIISNYNPDNSLNLENMSLIFDEISIHPYTWLLDTKLLLALKSQLIRYEDYHNHSYRKLLAQINASIDNNCHEQAIFDKLNIDAISFKMGQDSVETKEVMHFKNIYSIYDSKSHIEHKRSLHEASDYCYEDIKDIELKETKNDIEIPICLSLVGRYATDEIAERDQSITYFGSYSSLSQMNENMYEYLARKNDYMFMALQLKQFNILKNINEIDARKYLLHSYRLNTCVGKLLADLGESSILFETLRIYIHNIITKENLNNYNYNQFSLIEGKTNYYSVNEFYNYCSSLSKKYNDNRLLQLIEKSKREIIGIDISYHDPELGKKTSNNSEMMWKRIEEIFNKIINVQDNDEMNQLRDEIMLDSGITGFLKNKLLNCINPKISFFDTLLIDKDYVLRRYSYDIVLLEELLEKEKNYSFEGIEEIINLLEICLQYYLLENNDKIHEYIRKINDYVDKNIIYDNEFNYLLFKLVFAFIKVIELLKFKSGSKLLVLNLYYNWLKSTKYNEKYIFDEDVFKLLDLYDSYSQNKVFDANLHSKENTWYDLIFNGHIKDEKED